MGKHKKEADNIRKRLLIELVNEVDERFEGNKAKAALFLKIHRVPFTNLCNEREGVTIDKLIEIGSKLGWKIELSIDRDKGDLS